MSTHPALQHGPYGLLIAAVLAVIAAMPATAATLDYNATARLPPQVIAGGISPSQVDLADDQLDIVALVRPGVLPIESVSFRDTTGSFSLAMALAGVLSNGDELYKGTFTFLRGSFGITTLSSLWGDDEGQFNVTAVDQGQQRSHRFPDLKIGNYPAQTLSPQPEMAPSYNATRRFAPQVVMGGLSPTLSDVGDTAFDIIALVREGELPLAQVTVTQNHSSFANAMIPAGRLGNGDVLYKSTFTYPRGAFSSGTVFNTLWGNQPGQFNIQAVDQGQQRTHAFPDIEFGNYPELEAQNTAPSVTFTANPATGNAPLQVTLTAAAMDADGSIEGYAWSSSDGQTASGAATTMSFDQAGSYIITLLVTDDDGATAEATRTVTVTEAPNIAPTASLSATPASGNAPLTISLDGSGSTDADGSLVSYVWSSSDGQTATGVSASLTFDTPGVYVVNLTVTDDDGAIDWSNKLVTVTETPNAAPTASFTAAPTSGNAPLTIALDGSGSTDADGSIVEYAWSSSDGQTASGVAATMSFDQAGSHIIRLLVTDDDGATAEANHTVTVTEAPNAAPTASFTAVPTSGTAPLMVTLDGTASSDPEGAIASYAWSSSDGQATLGANASLTFDQAGSYVITLTVTDDDGATATAQEAVTVSAASTPTASNGDSSTGNACPSSTFIDVNARVYDSIIYVGDVDYFSFTLPTSGAMTIYGTGDRANIRGTLYNSTCTSALASSLLLYPYSRINAPSIPAGTYVLKITGQYSVSLPHYWIYVAYEGSNTSPEMDINGNGYSISDGGTIISGANNTLFDYVWGTIHIFTITNTGNAELNLTGTPPVSISGSHAGDFSVTRQPDTLVPIGGSTTFEVHFSPTAEGLREAMISIPNDDSNENPYNFAILGNSALLTLH